MCIELTILFDMCDFCRTFPVAFVEKIADKIPEEGLRVRLIGCGVNGNTGRPLTSMQKFVSNKDLLCRQAAELIHSPFACERGGVAEGLNYMMNSANDDREAKKLVFIVSGRSEEAYEVVRPVVEKLRSSGVFVRFVSSNMPESVVAAVRERSGGYVRVAERRGDMTILARYSCQFGPREREFNDYILHELLEFKPEIDIERFTKPEKQGGWGWSINKVWDLYEDVLWNNPQIFYVNKMRSIDASRKKIVKMPYAIKRSEYAACKAELDAAAKKALSLVAGVSDPVEKARILHDYVVLNCEYDTRGVDNPKPIYRTAYDVLVRHLAVCEGYVMGYRYLLSLAGIESEEVESDKMRHCWSYLHINGNWYHVDATFDDPWFVGKELVKDRYVRHKFFMLSDAALRARGEHHDWSVRGLPPATDTTYDKRVWQREWIGEVIYG